MTASQELATALLAAIGEETQGNKSAFEHLSNHGRKSKAWMQDRLTAELARIDAEADERRRAVRALFGDLVNDEDARILYLENQLSKLTGGKAVIEHKPNEGTGDDTTGEGAGR